MDWQVPEIDSLTQLRNAFRQLWRSLVEPIQRFADDLELAVDCGLRAVVIKVGTEIHAAGKADNVPRRLVDILQQDPGIRTHR